MKTLTYDQAKDTKTSYKWEGEKCVQDIHKFDQEKRLYFEVDHLENDQVQVNMLLYPVKDKGRFLQFISDKFVADGNWTEEKFVITCNIFTAGGKFVDSFKFAPHKSCFEHVPHKGGYKLMTKWSFFCLYYIPRALARKNYNLDELKRAFYYRAPIDDVKD